MARLCALKRTAELTEQQLDAWFGVLGGFPLQVVNRAILEVAVTDVRFPEIGDLYQLCRKSLPQKYSPHGSGEESKRPMLSEIRDIAARLGMEV